MSWCWCGSRWSVESDRSRRFSKVFIVHRTIIFIILLLWKTTQRNPLWHTHTENSQITTLLLWPLGFCCCTFNTITDNLTYTNKWSCSSPEEPWTPRFSSQLTVEVLKVNTGHSGVSRTWTHHQIFTWLAAGPERFAVRLLTEFKSCTNTNSETFTVLHWLTVS